MWLSCAIALLMRSVRIPPPLHSSELRRTRPGSSPKSSFPHRPPLIVIVLELVLVLDLTKWGVPENEDRCRIRGRGEGEANSSRTEGAPLLRRGVQAKRRGDARKWRKVSGAVGPRTGGLDCSLGKWKKLYGQGSNGLEQQADKERIKALERELVRISRQRDILKKALAILGQSPEDSVQ